MFLIIKLFYLGDIVNHISIGDVKHPIRSEVE